MYDALPRLNHLESIKRANAMCIGIMVVGSFLMLIKWIYL